MTGVNPVTLRAWERRYGLIRPQRTPKGHRLYTERDIDRINQILVLLDRGIPISQARQVLDEGETTPSDSAADRAVQGEDAWTGFLNRMRTAVTVYDEHALADTFEEACSLFAASQVQQHLLAPLHRHFANPASTEDQAAHSFLRGWLRNTLGTRLHHRSRRASGPRLLLGTLDRNSDDIPLLLLALQLIDHGYRTVLLGGAVDGDTLSTAARQSGAEGVMLWNDDHGSGAPALAALADEIPVFVAGDAASAPPLSDNIGQLEGNTPDAISRVNAHYYQRHTA